MSIIRSVKDAEGVLNVLCRGERVRWVGCVMVSGKSEEHGVKRYC